MRRAPLTLALLLGACSSSIEPASCPPGTAADEAGACRLECTEDEACLLTEACLDELCQPKTTAQPTIELFRATPTSVTRGQSATVEFVVVGADRIELLRSDADGTDVSLGIDSGDLAARVEIRRIISDTRVRLEAYRGEQIEPEEIIIRMDGANPNDVSIESFEASPTEVEPGGRVVLTWATRNATQVILARNGEQIDATLDVDGSYEDMVTESSVYTLFATGPAGSDEAQAAVDLESVAGGPRVEEFSFVPSNRVIDEGSNAVVKWRTVDADRTILSEDGRPILSVQDPLLRADGAWLVHPPPGAAAYRVTAQAAGQSPASKTEILDVVPRPSPPQLSGVDVAPIVFTPTVDELVELQIGWQVTPGDARVVVQVGQQSTSYTGPGTHSVRVPSNEAARIEVRAVVPQGGVDVAPLLAVPQFPEAGGSGPNRPESVDGVARVGQLDRLTSSFEADWYELAVRADGRLYATLYGDCPAGLRLQVYAQGAVTPFGTAQAQSDGDCPSLEQRDLAAGPYRFRASLGGNFMLGPVPYGIYAAAFGPACGDGRQQAGEACDDGNRAFGDRCLPTCAIDPSYQYEVQETSASFGAPPSDAEALRFLSAGAGDASAPGAAVVAFDRPRSFFGRTVHGAMVFTDGYLSFLPGAPGTEFSPGNPSGPVAPNALVAVAVADLSLQDGEVLTWTEVDPQSQVERVVIAWQDVAFVSGGPLRARIELFADGRVALSYGEDIGDDGAVFQAGLEGPTGQHSVPLPACDGSCRASELAGRRFVFRPGPNGMGGN